VCDNAENCTGTSAPCPADQKSTAVCRAAAGVCDVAESCDGVNDTCPADQLAPASTVCRAASGTCDVAETCTGTSTTCPADVAEPDGTSCNDGNLCTTPDTCEGGVCVGTPAPGSCGDHYLCYKVKPQAPFTKVLGVHLVDQFEDITADITKLRELCTPVSKNGEPVNDDVTHLAAYSFKAVSGTPHFARTTHIRLDNQVTAPGGLFVDTIKRDLLLVPTNKNLSTPPPAPDNDAIGVDHYKCYKAKVTAGTPKFVSVTVTVADQFTGVTPKSVVLKKIRHLCAPVSTNGAAVKNGDIHLACFQTKLASGAPKHVRRSGVQINDEFGPLTLGTIKERELCIPSIKTLTP
jgi:hypothetical protein